MAFARQTMAEDPPHESQPGFGAGIPRPSARSEAEQASGYVPASGEGGRDRAPSRNQSEVLRALSRLRAQSRGPEPGTGPTERAAIGSAVATRLARALGGCAISPNSEADLERAVGAAASDAALACSPLFAYRPHWADPPADVLARISVALERGASALVILQPESRRRWEGGLELLRESCSRGQLEWAEDAQLDGVRALAAQPDVAVDVSLPIDFASGLGEALVRIRDDAAKKARAAGDSSVTASPVDWFGEGIVEAPTPPLRVLEARGRSAFFGALAHGSPADAETSDSLILDGSLDPMDAAEQVADAAFGEHVLGGYGTSAVSRVIVRADRLSVFTECLVEVLEDGYGSEPLSPPQWATAAPARLTRGLDPGLQAARRLGTDEGSTLIFESRRSGQRALVFTNVEARMRLGGGLKAPAVLALMRG